MRKTKQSNDREYKIRRHINSTLSFGNLLGYHNNQQVYCALIANRFSIIMPFAHHRRPASVLQSEQSNRIVRLISKAVWHVTRWIRAADTLGCNLDDGKT